MKWIENFSDFVDFSFDISSFSPNLISLKSFNFTQIDGDKTGEREREREREREVIG